MRLSKIDQPSNPDSISATRKRIKAWENERTNLELSDAELRAALDLSNAICDAKTETGAVVDLLEDFIRDLEASKKC